MKSRGSFGSRYGFYMTAIGTAFGLGNLWRFPYIVGNNGGGAFVFLYLFFVAAIGLPILIGELALGKLSRRNLVGALAGGRWATKFRGWGWFGRLGMIACFVVMSYYTVVSGWVLFFAVAAIQGKVVGAIARPELLIDRVTSSGWLQLAFLGIHLFITGSIVARGVQNGIERVAKVLMPALFITLLVLVGNSLLLPSAPEAFRFLFYPDFSKLTPNAPIEALGHALFTLSLGFGAMVTFGSYLHPGVHMPGEAVFIASMDTFLSFCAAVLIFPIVFAAKVDVATGPVLLFKTIPVLLSQLKLGYFFGIAFFVCLYLSALMSSISLFEGVVSYFVDEMKFRRKVATWTVGAITFALGLLSAFSGSFFKNIRVGERGVLEIIDQVIINWTLPVVCIGVALFVSRVIPEDELKAEFQDPATPVSARLFSTWRKYIGFFAPILISVLIALQVVVALVSRN